GHRRDRREADAREPERLRFGAEERGGGGGVQRRGWHEVWLAHPGAGVGVRYIVSGHDTDCDSSVNLCRLRRKTWHLIASWQNPVARCPLRRPSKKKSHLRRRPSRCPGRSSLRSAPTSRCASCALRRSRWSGISSARTTCCVCRRCCSRAWWRRES